MKILYSVVLFLLISIGCKEPYTAPIATPPTGYLVVEGFINSGEGPTTITLTRTTQLYDSVDIVYEKQAQVIVESENNASFPLSETTAGVYVASQLFLNNNEKYRIHIITVNGKEYASDFVTVKSTPDIDSISWQREDDGGVQLYTNTHDPTNNTRYYRWSYEETWEFHSAYMTILEYIYDPIQRPIGLQFRNADGSVDTTIFKCWKTVNSTNIILGSTEKLSQDIVYLPLVYIEPASEKISVLYSIHLRQYALSKDAYRFYEKIKKNTEQLGSIFDPQPSELKGNIHCLSNPSEIVVGFVEVSEEKQERIFISRSQVPDWGYSQICYTSVVDNHPDSIAKYGMDLHPTIPKSYMGPEILDFYASTLKCIDCTLRGTK